MKLRLTLPFAAAILAAAFAADARAQVPSGVPAPDFKAVTGADTPVSLADYKGKVVILDLWATWCGPCQASMPHLDHVYKAVKDQGVVALALCVMDNRKAYDAWVPKHQIFGFTVAFDPAGRAADSSVTGLYKVDSIPATFIIDRDGKIAGSVIGFEGDGDHRLEAALAKVGIKAAE